MKNVLILNEIFVINIVYFQFPNSDFKKSVIIVQDDKNSISSYEPNFFEKYRESVYIGQFVVNKLNSYVCLRLFPVL